jgi:hypothetical protein
VLLRVIYVVWTIAESEVGFRASEYSFGVAVFEAISAEHSVAPQDPEIPRNAYGQRGCFRDVIWITAEILRRQVRQNPIEFLGAEPDNIQINKFLLQFLQGES